MVITLGFEAFLRDKRVDPSTSELVTIASCAGHSFVITREIPESEDIEYLTENSYARYGSICHDTHLYHDQSILRNGLDVAFGVKAQPAATNPKPLRHYGLYCYLDLRVAIRDLGLKVMFSKTAPVVLVEDSVPPEALCPTRKSPQELGSMCLPQQRDLILPRGRDADRVPQKQVGKIFKASPLLRPRPTTGPAASSLPPFSEEDQPIVIVDDDDTQMTGGSTGSGLSGAASSEPKPSTGPVPPKRRRLLKVPPSTRPRAVLKRTAA